MEKGKIPFKGKLQSKQITRQESATLQQHYCEKNIKSKHFTQNFCLFCCVCIAASPEMHDTFLTIRRNLILHLTQGKKKGEFLKT